MRAPRVLAEELRGRVLGAVVANAAAERFQFGDPVLDPPLGPVEQR
jgi:hypothetical protein